MSVQKLLFLCVPVRHFPRADVLPTATEYKTTIDGRKTVVALGIRDFAIHGTELREFGVDL